MIAVDLLPADEARAAAARRRARRLGMAGIASVALGLGLGHAALAVGAAVTRRQIAHADAERVVLERPVAALRRLRQRQASLRSRLAILERLEAGAGGPASMLAALAAAAPAKLRLTELTLTGERLELGGVATDERTIADFVARLRQVHRLRGMDLEDAARDDGAVPAVSRFMIAGRLERDG